ncbi:hypothetical protein NDU88_011630 [Pleurodeles waltl]|uniref:Uncharacterized protein n=1 Tax=Pleurodeles waltl TaxID=8319 RepID=A0AAV7PZA8_PLEWA|nr:hypothetical protein NDU88_011630 [Pleurodeles waltl]
MTGRVQGPPAAGVTVELMTGRVQGPPAAGVTEELMTGAGSEPPRRGRYCGVNDWGGFRAPPRRSLLFIRSTEAARVASLPFGSPQCSREGWAVKGVAPPYRGKAIRRRTLEEPTGERTEERRSDHGKAGDAWNPWEKSGPEPTPSQSRPRDEDRWPRGAHE